MDDFAWAQNNLGVTTPQELQGRGVGVHVAPNLSSGEKVVNLANGQVEQFLDGEERPERGYYAAFAGLERFCRAQGIALNETDGTVSVQSAGRGEAGDPLQHGGR